MASDLGSDLSAKLRSASIMVYTRAAEWALQQGLILADTKFEWGLDPASGEIVLADEVLTPDSSRFWDAELYQPGGAQPSFDKQFVRDWLDQSGWDHASRPPPPPPGNCRQNQSQICRRLRACHPQSLCLASLIHLFFVICLPRDLFQKKNLKPAVT